MNATTKILALACAGLLALAGTASAHHGTGGASVYGAKLAAPGATTTTFDPAAIHGKAILVDGGKNNILAVKVRNLTPNTEYSFGIAGTDFAPTTATTDADGKLKGFAKSATFNAVAGTTYTVQVKQGDTVVAQGDLAPIRFQKHFGFGRHKHGHHGGSRHHGGFKRFDRSGDKAASQAESGDSGHNCHNGDQGEQS
jgi:hypothetical protein